MSGSVNKVILVGNVGNTPEVRAVQSTGNEIVTLSLATTERWKDRNSGEQKEKTDWHKIVIFSPGLVSIVKRYVKKGSKIYIEGKLQTREYTDQSGTKKYTTEVVLGQFNSSIVLMDSKGADNHSTNIPIEDSTNTKLNEDEIPF